MTNLAKTKRELSFPKWRAAIDKELGKSGQAPSSYAEAAGAYEVGESIATGANEIAIVREIRRGQP